MRSAMEQDIEPTSDSATGVVGAGLPPRHGLGPERGGGVGQRDHRQALGAAESLDQQRVRGAAEPAHVDVAKGLPIAYAVSFVLIAMSVLLIYADVVNPIKLGG